MITLLTLATIGQAEATEGLQWRWDAPRRYFIEADVLYPEYKIFQAENNREVRIAATTVRIDTTCAPNGKQGKSVFYLRCDLTDVAFLALPLDSDRGNVVPILDDLERLLEPAWVQVQLGADGRIRSVDLEGMAFQNLNDRAQYIQELLRLVLIRGFAALDLELPSKGDDGGVPWTVPSSLVTAFPSQMGSMGMTPLDVGVARTAGSLVTLSTKGGGIARSGERVGNSYEMAVSGWASFDLATGGMVARQYTVNGALTASSVAAEGVNGSPYNQSVRLTLIKDGDPAPQLGPNGERAE